MRKAMSAGGQAQPRKRKKRRLWKRVLAYLTLMFLILLLGGMTFAGVLYYQVAQMMPSVGVIENYQPREASFIYSADGVLLARIAEEYREPATLEEIPKHLINATIAKEDRRFWQHSGVDWRGAARALWVNLTEGDIKQGGSTLTQQLARNVFLTQRRTIARKIQEIILAQEMERRLTKERILELYLNQVYYGNGAYGVKAAARVYFNKPLEQLTLAECALLAALPQRPSGYDPFSNPDEAISQRNLVLDLMAREGYITPAQRDAAKAEPLRLARSRPRSQFLAPYFVMDVLRELEALYGRELLLQGNLKVNTTLHMEMQRAAESALRRGIQAFRAQGVTQGAIVLIDLRTGQIRALVGGVDFRRTQFNNITQGRRQPGSAFKPIVYATAFELGKLTPNSTLSDTPLDLPAGGGKRWRPQNADGKFRGVVSVTRALAASINIPAIRAAQLVGADKVAEFARTRFGIESPLDPVLPLALGASAVRPIELARAYSVFPLKGNRIEPFMIRRVEDQNGVVLLDQQGQITPNVLSPQTAEWIDQILRTAVVSGTGQAASRIPNARGKTGTTSDHRDAWFVGYTDEYLALVWVASEYYNPQTQRWEYRPMKRVFGGTVCARIWADLMERVNAIERQLQLRQARPSQPAVGEPASSPEQEPLPTDNTGDEAPPPIAPPHTEEPPRTPTEPPAGTEPDSPTTTSAPTTPIASTPTDTRTADAAPSVAGGAPRESRPPAPPPAPEYITVSICADTGLIATDYCPEVISKRFEKGKEPKSRCNRHGVRLR
ncbi:MAG: penicillin-binding protein [Armatimonadetes bacterium JP3_11]|jgi:penicillin-binding protein 1A|nr:MAG: penicillin-binding protein [Armatimonadetes bacterium JP3_11]RMH09386.1 MAG: PBP1A family penicillin-binding protein [Armatimonadota bacterium]